MFWRTHNIRNLPIANLPDCFRVVAGLSALGYLALLLLGWLLYMGNLSTSSAVLWPFGIPISAYILNRGLIDLKSIRVTTLFAKEVVVIGVTMPVILTLIPVMVFNLTSFTRIVVLWSLWTIVVAIDLYKLRFLRK